MLATSPNTAYTAHFVHTNRLTLTSCMLGMLCKQKNQQTKRWLICNVKYADRK
ncbi:MAG: hypothetical protein KFBDDELM_00202 [Candidatus Argoarchaeum ethanivorans]|uniref:Uncharacterized protein n=1 Tax=Candidatus Argoarchaeum ethanivorans TaxID=2608793 RepID=A0A811T4P4_9EURY|nr:MAG: hypothetical protein KFBDDELM_00202 [Candidatus Argoarchaeum ethanivorans]